MSKNEQSRENPKDIFAVYKQNVDKYFNTIEQSLPLYHQSLTNVQQEYLHACENAINSVISLEKEYALKTGINTNVPDASLKVICDVTEETVKAYSVRNQIALATIDTIYQNIKTFNDNAKAFADLNKNIMLSWISSFTSKNN